MKFHVHPVEFTGEPRLKIDVQIGLADAQVVHSQLGALVVMKDASHSGHLHGPGLPEVLMCVALPAGMAVADVHALATESTALTSSPVMLAPVQPPRRTPTDRRLLRRSTVHVQEALYQAELRKARPLVRLIQVQQLGDVSLAHLALSPVGIRLDGSLTLVTRCAITVMLAAVQVGREAKKPMVVSPAQRVRFEQLARARALNPEQIVPGPLLSPLPTAVDHLIITDNHTWDAKTSKVTGTLAGDLPKAFERLAGWRKGGGLKSRVVTVSDIVNKSFGDFSTGSRDLQHTLRKFLIWAQANWGVAYLLLGGSHKVVPVRSLAVSWMSETAPSDFYYANLGVHDDWCEGATPDFSTADFAVHLSVGRVAVESAAKADGFVNKVIEYEELKTAARDPISSDYLRRVLIAATSWNRELRVDISRTGASPPGENTFLIAPEGDHALIKLHETLTLTRFVPAGGATTVNPDPNTYTHFSGQDYAKLHLLEAATYKEVKDVVAVLANGQQKTLTYRKDACSAKPGWYFDLDTTNFIKVFGPLPELEPACYTVHLKPALREAQNLLRCDLAGDTHPIPYDHQAYRTGLGWYFARGAADLAPSALVAGLPSPTPWIVVYDSPFNLSASQLQRFILDPTSVEGSMADQEVLRKQMALDMPEWDDIHRLYEDQFDLPRADRHEPPLQQFNAARFRDLVNVGQHAISLSGHGWMDGCCDGVNNALADALKNNSMRSIVYADSCLTARFTDDALSTHFTLSPSGGAVAYVGYTDESEMGLSKFFQQQFFRGLAQSGCLGIAFDSRAQLLQPGYWDYDPGASGPRRMILIGSLAGDPAMRLTLSGEFALQTASGLHLSTTAGGGMGTGEALRSDAFNCGPWETFTLVPLGNARYALRTLDGHHLTIDGGGGKAIDAVHSNQPDMGPFESVRIEPHGARKVALLTPNGKYLSAVGGGGRPHDALRSDAIACAGNELFTLVRRHDAGLPIYLKTASGNYLTAIEGRAQGGEALHSNAVSAGPWERFTLMPLGCGQYALRTSGRRYLTAVNGGGRVANTIGSDATSIGAFERFTFLPQGEGRFVLQTADGHFVTFMDGGGRASDVVHTNAKDIGPWERLSMVAEYSFQTSSGRYLTAESGGGLTHDALHTDARAASVFEKFTVVTLGTPCAFQTPSGRYLTAMAGGGRKLDALHSDAVAISIWERFTVVPLGGGKVAVQTLDGHYVTAMSGGGRSTDVIHTDAVSIGPWEQFVLVPQGQGRHALQTSNGRYLTVVGGGGRNVDAIHTDATAVGPHEKLLLIPLAGEQVALRTCHGQYLTAVGGGGLGMDAVHTDAQRIGPFERFTLLPLGSGRFALQTMNACYLTAVDGGGKAADAVHANARKIGPWEVFEVRQV